MSEPEKQQDVPTTEGQQETPDTVTPPEDNGGEDTGAIQLTSAQLAQRLERAQQTALNKLFESLGVDNADTIKQVLSAEKQRQEAEMSELEKANAEIERLKAEAQQAKLDAEKAQQERLVSERNAAIRGALAGVRKDKVGSVLTLLQAEHADKVEAVLQDGAIDQKAVDTLAELARKEYSGFFEATTPGSQSNSDGKPPSQVNKQVLEEISKRFRY